MQIVIDIDENVYTGLFDNGTDIYDTDDILAMTKVIRKGTPLDKIRTEIEKHCGLVKENHCKYCSYCNSVMGVREILEIIDKYKTEREE